MQTYFGKVGEKTVKMNEKIKTVFFEPTVKKNMLVEVFPVINIPKINGQDYLMQLYFNAVKVMARQLIVNKKKSEATYFYGLNKMRIKLNKENKEIVSVTKNEYELLDNVVAYIIAQILYESIENKPFTLKLGSYYEEYLKKIKFYLKKAYMSSDLLILDYMCRPEKVILKLQKNFKALNEAK